MKAACFAMFTLAQTVLSRAASYDFVVVGGGPAGLIVANRLSANPDLTVAVIEAGGSVYENPNVTCLPRTIAEFSPGIGTSIDWKYTSGPQKHTANRSLSLLAGKALAGSTAIFGMTYLRAEQAQIDAWEQLGNAGWDWSTMWPYYTGQEVFQTPSAEQQKNGATYDEHDHGHKGHVHIGFTPYLTGQGAFDLLQKTTEVLGLPLIKDANSGTMRGTTTWPSFLRVEEEVREDAARSFFWPVAAALPNLHVYLNTTASKIIWENSSGPTQAVACGVEVITAENMTQVIQAKRQVIVAAGSLRSPALLEHSGVGFAPRLQALGIDVVVSQSTVGSQLIDQPANGLAFSSSTNWTGYSTFATYLTASDLFGSNLESISAEVRANISSYAGTIVADYAPGTTNIKQQIQLLEHHVNLIFSPNSTVPLAEILWIFYNTAMVSQFWNLLPLSRGAVHIVSRNPRTAPSIDPNYFQLPIDMYVQAATAVWIRKFVSTAPLSQHLTGEDSPSFDVVPQNATWRDAAWHQWIAETYNSNSHPVSTCAMRSEHLGGVVDNEGRVYGTRNVRVVDASVFPTQISGHLTASIYAVGGKMADGILRKL
ncbi:hypothetical protein ACEQ8H_006510 [Pleosporales sp. CAS-2024a]